MNRFDLCVLVDVASVDVDRRDREGTDEYQYSNEDPDRQQDRSDDPEDSPCVGGPTVLGWSASCSYGSQLGIAHDPRKRAEDLTENDGEYSKYENGRRLTLFGIAARIGRELRWLLCHVDRKYRRSDRGRAAGSLKAT